MFCSLACARPSGEEKTKSLCPLCTPLLWPHHPPQANRFPQLGPELDAIWKFNPLYRDDNPGQEGDLKYLGDGKW